MMPPNGTDGIMECSGQLSGWVSEGRIGQAAATRCHHDGSQAGEADAGLVQPAAPPLPLPPLRCPSLHPVSLIIQFLQSQLSVADLHHGGQRAGLRSHKYRRFAGAVGRPVVWAMHARLAMFSCMAPCAAIFATRLALLHAWFAPPPSP